VAALGLCGCPVREEEEYACPPPDTEVSSSPTSLTNVDIGYHEWPRMRCCDEVFSSATTTFFPSIAFDITLIALRDMASCDGNTFSTPLIMNSPP
jgi:hypothetical protein